MPIRFGQGQEQSIAYSILKKDQVFLRGVMIVTIIKLTSLKNWSVRKH